MARQTQLVLRVASLASFLFILLRLFGVFKAQQQPHQARLSISPFSSSLVFQNKKDFSTTDEKTREIHIAAVVCGNRATEALVMMKSALIMCSNFIRFTLFVDSETSNVLNETIRLWPDNILKRMSLDMRPVSFPKDNADKWKTLFKPCSSVRLFLPVSSRRDMFLAVWMLIQNKNLLKKEDSILYMDVDTVFLSSPLHIWQHLSKMNTTQMIALGPEAQDSTIGWYPQFANHPYYGKFGGNAGVMLMNLTKMRQFGWEKYIIHVYEQYQNRMMWGDQDLINVIFHFHPEKLYVYPCHHSYISGQCSVTSLCKEAEQQEIYILHGNTEAFLNDHLPALKAIYTSIQQHSFGDNLQMLFVNMKENLMKTPTSDCRKVMSSFLKLVLMVS